MNLLNKLNSKLKLRNAYALRIFYIDTQSNNIAISAPYIIPEGMTNGDALSTVSILYSRIQNAGSDYLKEQQAIDLWEKLAGYGFTPVAVPYKTIGHFHTTDYSNEKFNAIPGVTDLFIVDGEMKDFKQTPFKNRYFDWEDKNLKDYEEIFKRMHANRYKNNSNGRTV